MRGSRSRPLTKTLEAAARRALPALLCCLLAASAAAAAPPAAPPPAPAPADAGLDGALIERLTGAKGALDAGEGVFKVSVPRTDLDVRVGGVRLRPRLGLTSWAAFHPMAGGAMVMGDLVLAAAQVDAVMSAALDGGLAVTALHNHFLGDEPRVMFLHVDGHGSVEALATAVGRVFRAMAAKPPAAAPAATIDPAATTLQPAPLEEALHVHGELKDGVLRFVIGKPTHRMGEPVGAAMGLNTWAAFAGSPERAVVDGDFAMFEPELQPVLQALRGAGLSVVAIHNHMTGENPRVVFLHYWGLGPALQLARGLRSALDAQNSVGGEP
jgi:uncharacterized protein DUF1259